MPFLVLALLGPAAPAWSQEVSIRGAGNWSCAKWLSSDAMKSAGATWVSGFWSGRNSEGATKEVPRRVGDSTDWDGIIGEIALRCRQKPSEPFVSAVSFTYTAMLKAGR